jgi:hypothetical protein
VITVSGSSCNSGTHQGPKELLSSLRFKTAHIPGSLRVTRRRDFQIRSATGLAVVQFQIRSGSKSYSEMLPPPICAPRVCIYLGTSNHTRRRVEDHPRLTLARDLREDALRLQELETQQLGRVIFLGRKAAVPTADDSVDAVGHFGRIEGFL